MSTDKTFAEILKSKMNSPSETSAFSPSHSVDLPLGPELYFLKKPEFLSSHSLGLKYQRPKMKTEDHTSEASTAPSEEARFFKATPPQKPTEPFVEISDLDETARRIINRWFKGDLALDLETISLKVLKKGYRALAKKYHPDQAATDIQAAKFHAMNMDMKSLERRVKAALEESAA